MIEILKFYADWCGPCTAIKPIVNEVKSMYPNITFKDINIEVDNQIAEKYGVKSIPTIIFLYNTIEVSRHMGTITEMELIDQIEELK